MAHGLPVLQEWLGRRFRNCSFYYEESVLRGGTVWSERRAGRPR